MHSGHPQRLYFNGLLLQPNLIMEHLTHTLRTAHMLSFCPVQIMIQTTSFKVLLYNSKPRLYKDKKCNSGYMKKCLPRPENVLVLKPYCVLPHRQGSHVQAAKAQRRPPSQILKAGRVKATRWVPTAAEMKLMLLKLSHKNPFFFCFWSRFECVEKQRRRGHRSSGWD